MEPTGRMKGAAQVSRRDLAPVQQRAWSFSKADGKKLIFKMGIFVGDKSREHDLGLPATPHSLHLEAKPCYKGKQKKTIDIKELTPEMKIREKETVTYGDHSSGQTFQSLKPSQMLYTLKFCSLQINKTIKKYN